jgi:hypothetical protein
LDLCKQGASRRVCFGSRNFLWPHYSVQVLTLTFVSLLIGYGHSLAKDISIIRFGHGGLCLR